MSKNITVMVYTREEAEGFIKSADNVIAELTEKTRQGKHLTDFGNYRVEKAKETKKKWSGILNAFPDKQEFCIYKGNVVDVQIKSLMEC